MLSLPARGSSLAAKLNISLHLAFKDYRATYGLFIFEVMSFGSNLCVSLAVLCRYRVENSDIGVVPSFHKIF